MDRLAWSVYFPLKKLPKSFFSFCDVLRWFGTDLEAGFVIYAENDPKPVFGVSLGMEIYIL